MSSPEQKGLKVPVHPDMSLHRHGNNTFDHADGERNVLALNVLLLGDRQSGRSSVGNALIGGNAFQTGVCVSDVSVTTKCRRISWNFPKYFRRQGAESDLTLNVTDTPPGLPRPHDVHELCPEGVHVIMIVVRADLINEKSRLVQHVETLFGPEWHHHTLLLLTHADRLKEAGFKSSDFLSQTTDWLRSLAKAVDGGFSFIDNNSNWPSIRGRPIRDRALCLSAKNHHRALRVRTEGSPEGSL